LIEVVPREGLADLVVAATIPLYEGVVHSYWTQRRKLLLEELSTGLGSGTDAGFE